MELGNAVFGHSFGEWPIPRAGVYEKGIMALLWAARCDEYGYPLDKNIKDRFGRDGFENDTFAVRPYYWGECTCGWDELEGRWFEENHHRPDCYQIELQKIDEDYTSKYGYMSRNNPYWGEYWQKITELLRKHGLPEVETGYLVHCTCDYEERYQEWFEENKLGPEGHAPDCPIVVPNFEFKGGGGIKPFFVRWYKYPLRDSYASRKIPPKEWRAAIEVCMDSVKKENGGDTGKEAL